MAEAEGDPVQSFLDEAGRVSLSGISANSDHIPESDHEEVGGPTVPEVLQTLGDPTDSESFAASGTQRAPCRGKDAATASEMKKTGEPHRCQRPRLPWPR